MIVRTVDAPIASARSRALDVMSLFKIRLNLLVLTSVAAGYYLAAPPEVPVLPLVGLLLGILFAGGGASAVNMAMEAGRDRLMERTRQRPVAAGRIGRDEAASLGGAAAACGVGLVVLAAGVVPAALCAATVLLYVFAYTPLKTRTPLNTLVGAIPGALPPLIGWTAASGGAVPPEAASLFGIVFLWQFPHFLAIASIYKEEYARAGYAMLPVVDPSGWRTAHRVVAYSLVLVPTSLLPTLFHLTGRAYFVGALALSLFYLFSSVRAARLRTEAAYRDLLRASLVMLPGLFVLMMIDRWPG
jgi:protoheme IX farnesyltransferase